MKRTLSIAAAALFATQAPFASPFRPAPARAATQPPVRVAFQEPPFELESLLPEETIAAASFPGLDEFLERGLDDPCVKALLDGPAGRLWLSRLEVPPRTALVYASGLVGEPLLPALASLVRRGLLAALVHTDAQPQLLLIARGDDPQRWERLLDRILEALSESSDVSADLAGAFTRVAGARLWDLGEAGAFAQRGALFVLAGKRRLVEDALSKAEALDSNRDSHARSDEANALCVAWFDRDRAEAALGPQALAELSSAAREPAVHLLLGSDLALLTAARRFEARLFLDGPRIALELTGLGIELAAAEELVSPTHGELPPPLPEASTDTVARAVLRRDLSALFAHRAALFPPASLPGFAQAASDLRPLLGGLDLEEQLLPALDHRIRVVVRNVPLDSAAAPSIRLPAAALIVELREPRRVGPTLVAAFQSLVAITNVERAQQGRPPLVLSLERVGEHELTRAALPQPEHGEEVDIAYNLEPACVLVGSTFILGTHVELVRQLLEQIERGDVDPSPANGERWELFGSVLSELIATNRASLISNGILNEGKTPEEAEFEADLLAALARSMSRAVLATDRPAEDTLRVRLDFELDASQHGEAK